MFLAKLSWQVLNVRNWAVTYCWVAYKGQCWDSHETMNIMDVHQSQFKGELIITVIISADINECHEGTHGCRQECINTNGSYYCACRPGYRLLADGYTCIGKLWTDLKPFYARSLQIYYIYNSSDIDECSEGSHMCDQICHNSVGSYACSCHSGYRLDRNGLTCNGILKF